MASRLHGQLRAIPGAVIGFDMGAALAMARALGINPVAVAEFLPVIEAAIVKTANEKMGSGDLKRGDV
ncbi:MAG: hypothetical protein V6Z86_07360 [Hyphomicrobiales bacterium]